VNIVALLRMVPDVVEELQIDPDGRRLDFGSLRLIVNEQDDQALEEALLLKERKGGTVTALALDALGIDEVLYTALAKGADRAVKVSGVPTGLSTRESAALLAAAIPRVSGAWPADLILCGCWAIDDLDAQLGAFLSVELGLPYLGMVVGVADVAAGEADVAREYARGVRGRFTVPLPALLGIQTADKPPRYVPVVKVRKAMETQSIDAVPAPELPEGAAPRILGLMKPEGGGHAAMIEGSVEEVASKICDVLYERGLL
jgi:electron transfer flavoprotein beta subunit